MVVWLVSVHWISHCPWCFAATTEKPEEYRKPNVIKNKCLFWLLELVAGLGFEPRTFRLDA